MFKRLKDIENAQKNSINSKDKKDDGDKKKSTKQQYRVKTTKCLSLFKKFQSRSKDLMDGIEDANGDIDDGQLLLLVAMRKNFTLTLLIKD